MGKKQLKSLLLLLVIFGAIAIGLTMMKSGKVEKVKSITDREDLFAGFPINEVESIVVETEDGSVELKKGETAWTVSERDGYQAKTETIEKFLKMIWALKIVQNVDVGESKYGRLHLADSDGDKQKGEGKVEKTIYFKDKEGKALRTLYLGKTYERMENSSSPLGGGPSMTAVGRYVRIADEVGVFLVGETFAGTDIDPAMWLDEKFFKVENIKAIEIQSGKKEEDWKLSRDKPDAEFVLADVGKDEEYDPTRANAMKNAFVSPRFEDLIVGEEAAKKPNKTTFLIDTFAGFHYVVKVGEKNDLNEYYMTVEVSAKLDDKRAPVNGESEEDKKKNDEEFAKSIKAQKEKLAFEKGFSGKVFKVRSYVIDSINKKRADLMKQEGPPAGAQPGGIPANGAGGLPPGFQLPPGFKLPPGTKLPQGVNMPSGHPPVKKAPAPSKKPEKAKADGDKKPAIKAGKDSKAKDPSGDAKKDVKGEADKPASEASKSEEKAK